MSNGMRWNRLIAGLIMILVLILGLAWFAGGREPVREIAQSVAVPELPR
jgi:hypothetical protein